MAVIRRHWQMLVLAAVIFALWQTPVMLPLKILVVLFHELAHGLAAVLTGGRIVSLAVTPDQGGLAVTQGGSRFWVLSAGYLGSLALGLTVFAAALVSRADRLVLGLLGVVILGAAAFYIREGFALLFCLTVGGAMLAGAWLLPRVGADLVLRVIGLASVIYVPYDIVSDTILRAGERSDARMLAEEFGGATMLWGGLWLLLSLAVLWLGLRLIARGESHLA